MERDDAASEFKQRFFMLDIAWRELDLRADFAGKTSASRKGSYSRTELLIDTGCLRWAVIVERESEEWYSATAWKQTHEEIERWQEKAAKFEDDFFRISQLLFNTTNEKNQIIRARSKTIRYNYSAQLIDISDRVLSRRCTTLLYRRTPMNRSSPIHRPLLVMVSNHGWAKWR